MRDFFTRVRRDGESDPLIAARTPDDIIRFTSYLFASTKQIDKARGTRDLPLSDYPPVSPCSGHGRCCQGGGAEG